MATEDEALMGLGRWDGRTIGYLAVVLCLLVSPGCIRRRMTIRSTPPGAMVWIDDQQIGTTPVSTSFVYYGTRRIQIIKDGYETLTVYRNIKAPWYQVPPLDFVSENLVPQEIRDERVLDFELRPQVIPSLDETLREASNFRDSIRQDPTFLIDRPATTTPGGAIRAPGFNPPPALPAPLQPGIPSANRERRNLWSR